MRVVAHALIPHTLLQGSLNNEKVLALCMQLLLRTAKAPECYPRELYIFKGKPQKNPARYARDYVVACGDLQIR